MTCRLTFLVVGLLFVADWSLFASSEAVSKPHLELTLDSAQVHDPPTREDVTSALKQASGVLQETIEEVEAQSPAKRDAVPVATFEGKGVDLAIGEADKFLEANRKKRGGSIRATWGKKKRAVGLGGYWG